MLRFSERPELFEREHDSPSRCEVPVEVLDVERERVDGELFDPTRRKSTTSESDSDRRRNPFNREKRTMRIAPRALFISLTISVFLRRIPDGNRRTWNTVPLCAGRGGQ